MFLLDNKTKCQFLVVLTISNEWAIFLSHWDRQPFKETPDTFLLSFISKPHPSHHWPTTLQMRGRVHFFKDFYFFTFLSIVQLLEESSRSYSQFLDSFLNRHCFKMVTLWGCASSLVWMFLTFFFFCYSYRFVCILLHLREEKLLDSCISFPASLWNWNRVYQQHCFDCYVFLAVSRSTCTREFGQL